MPTDNTTTTWRDLADQLTDKERAAIEKTEQLFAESGRIDPVEAAEALLEYARDYIETRLTDIAYADVPVPPGAKVGKWEHNTDGDWSRSLVWAEYGEPEMYVDIDGRQEHDGSYTRLISVYLIEDGASLTSLGARRLAAHLVEAAAELDRLQ